MLHEIKIRVTSHWLGARHNSKTATRMFDRDKKSNILVDHVRWSWAYEEAVTSLRFKDIDIKTIGTPANFVSPKMTRFPRRWKDNGRDREEWFECITEGVVLTMQFAVTTPPPPNKLGLRSPDTKELKQIFEFIGGFLGMSPWGLKFGYGRFSVESLVVK